MPKTRIRTFLEALASNHVKFFAASDACEAVGLSDDECLRILQEFVQEGLLRITQSKKGKPYFWLVHT